MAARGLTNPGRPCDEACRHGPEGRKASLPRCSANRAAAFGVVLPVLLQLCSAASNYDNLLLSIDYNDGERELAMPSLAANSSKGLRSAVGELMSATAKLAAQQHADSHAPDAYLAICVAVKDQHKDAREWVDWHRAAGVGAFYVYDTGSSPPMAAVLGDYIESGLVRYTAISESDWRGKQRYAQIYVYDTCMRAHGPRHEWMAFIDMDEFLVVRDPAAHGQLPRLLAEYEQHGALGVNWIQFGSSGHEARPSGGVLRSYWACLPEQHSQHTHIKTIARIRNLGDAFWQDPHSLRFSGPHYCVNEMQERINGPRSVHPSHRRVVLHHYVTKSKQDYDEKMSRGSAMGNHKTLHFMRMIDAQATANCSTLMGLQRLHVTVLLPQQQPQQEEAPMSPPPVDAAATAAAALVPDATAAPQD